MTSFPPPSEIESPRVRRLHLYWESRRLEGAMPRRADIDPGDIRELLPYVMITEILRSPFDVRYRLVGTAIVEAYGYDFTGRNLRSMPVLTGLERWLRHYRRAAEAGRPLYGRYHGKIAPDLTRVVDHGIFPLSKGGAGAAQFIELEDWSNVRGISPSSLAHSVWSYEPC